MSALPFIISHLLIGCLSVIHCNSTDQNGVAIVPDETVQDVETTESTEPIIRTYEDGEAMNPQLIAALREINNDPSYLQQQEGQLVDLSQFEMDPEKLDEMIEIFDWIESQLPPDDPQQIQNILNNVNNYITSSNEKAKSNYTDNDLLAELTRLPDFLYQVDNGVDFMKMNGANILLKVYKEYSAKTDNDTSVMIYQILSQIMDTIGVATQNNPNAIQYAHQSHLVSFIIDELGTLCDKDADIPINGQLINKLLFALSSITRQSDVGLRQLQKKDGPEILFKCGNLLSTKIFENDATKNVDDDENMNNLERAFKKLLTLISDIVVLNGNKLEYSGMFLKDERWCALMIEHGLLFYPESVLQFIDYGLQRNYCVDDKNMLTTLKEKLMKIKGDNMPKNDDDDDEEEYYDESLLTQSINMLRHIDINFRNSDVEKTEL